GYIDLTDLVLGDRIRIAVRVIPDHQLSVCRPDIILRCKLGDAKDLVVVGHQTKIKSPYCRAMKIGDALMVLTPFGYERKHGASAMSSHIFGNAACKDVSNTSSAASSHGDKVGIDAGSEVSDALLLGQVIVDVECVVFQLQLLGEILHVLHHDSIALEVS